LIILLGLSGLGLMAAVEFNAQENTLWISDYPADLPCTMSRLLKLDKLFKWDKITYEENTKTYTVNCHLRIGKNDGSETYFQIGAAPEETVVVRGNVQVRPIWEKDRNPPAGEAVLLNAPQQNRLTLGLAAQPQVKGVLKIDNSRDYHLIIGGTSGVSTTNFGGQLYMYNSELGVTDLTVPDYFKNCRNSVSAGGNRGIILKNSRVSGFSFFGRGLTNGVFENSTFAQCGVALAGSYQEKISGCTFRNCDQAIIAASRRSLTIDNCEFRGNRINWVIEHNRLVAIDCMIDSFDKGVYGAKGGTIKDPYFVSKRHVLVKVTDKDGNPVPGATVNAVPNFPAPAPEYDVADAITGADGTTPGPDQKQALLLSEISCQYRPAPDTTVRQEYVYTLKAGKDGRTGKIPDFKPRQSWELITVKLTD
jgi:hypothetical protein